MVLKSMNIKIFAYQDYIVGLATLLKRTILYDLPKVTQFTKQQVWGDRSYRPHFD